MAGKLPKSQVEYEHPAKGDNHCGICRHFEADTHRCEIVDGAVQPQDWCDHFDRKRSLYSHRRG